jgi:hypothetical protein
VLVDRLQDPVVVFHALRPGSLKNC